MANTAPLSPDELAKKQKETEGQIKKNMAEGLANAGFMGGGVNKPIASQGLPDAKLNTPLVKPDRPLTGGATTPPPSPATNGFTPPAVATEAKAAALPSYSPPSEDLKKQLARPDTSSIPNGAPGTRSNMSVVGQSGELIKIGMPVDQAKQEGANVVPGLTSSTTGPSIDPKKAEQLNKGMTRQGDALVAKTKEVADAVSKWWNTPSETKQELYRKMGRNLGAK